MRHGHTPVLLTAPNVCFLPGTSGTLFTSLFPNFGIRTLCDLGGLSRVPMPRDSERQQAAHPVKVLGEPRDLRASGGERSRKRSGKGRAGVELSCPIPTHSRKTRNQATRLWPKGQKPICRHIFPLAVHRGFRKNGWEKGNMARVHIHLDGLPPECGRVPVTHSSRAASAQSASETN